MAGEVQINVAAMQSIIRATDSAEKSYRNGIVLNYYNGIDPDIKPSIVYRHGSAVYPKKTIHQFFKLINKRPIQLPIRFSGGDDNEYLSTVAMHVSNMVETRALGAFMNPTGNYQSNIRTYVRQIGSGTAREVSSIPNGSALPRRASISIVPEVAYASTLEARGVVGGILYYVAKKARAQYGSRIAFKFNYISGQRIGLSGGTYPQLTMGFHGNVRPGLKRPGTYANSARGRRRAERRRNR